MCRNIRTLFNFDPPATSDEVRAASLHGFPVPWSWSRRAHRAGTACPGAAAASNDQTSVSRCSWCEGGQVACPRQGRAWGDSDLTCGASQRLIRAPPGRPGREVPGG